MTNVSKIQMSPKGPMFSCLVQGYWRLAEWNFTPQQCISFIKEHVDLGITTVDHAHVYGNPSCESLFGEALKLDPNLRNQIEIISKCGISPAGTDNIGHYNSSKQAILSSVETSLLRFGTDYLDVLLIHRPDFLMNADEISEAFDQLKREGKVNYFGVSNFTSAQLSLLNSRVSTPLITNQIELNPVNLDIVENGALENLQEMRIHPMAWSCLCKGLIFRKNSEKMERLRQVLNQIAIELDVESIDQVIYAWVMKMPSKPVPILGSGKINRIKSAVESIKLSLTHEQWYRVWVASKGYNVP